VRGRGGSKSERERKKPNVSGKNDLAGQEGEGFETFFKKDLLLTEEWGRSRDLEPRRHRERKLRRKKEQIRSRGHLARHEDGVI